MKGNYIPEHIELLRDGYDKYLDCINYGTLDPKIKPLSYNFDFLSNRKLPGYAVQMIGGELREFTNLLNRWMELLEKWNAWNKTLKKYDDMEAWELRVEFVESFVHECLFKPSSTRDTFTFIATNAFHQVRLGSESTYKDWLEGDPTDKKPKVKYLTRNQKEKQLKKIIAVWEESSHFLDILKQINTKEYIEITSNYRNLVSHAIAPRLEIGHVQIVKRVIEKSKDSQKSNVSYVPSQISPLDLEKTRIENLKQFELARSCYEEYVKLLKNVVEKYL